MYWTQDRIMRLIIGLAITVALVLLVRYLSDVLLPFFVGCFLAYLMNPLVGFNQNLLHTQKRALASVMTMVDILALIFLLVYLFLPSVIRDVDDLTQIIRSINDGERQVPDFVMNILVFVDKYLNPEQIKSMLRTLHIDEILSRGSSLLNESIGVIVQTLGWLLTLIYTLFILIDYPQISRGFKLIFPRKYRPRALAVMNDVKVNLNHYFRGQGVVALFAMVFYCFGFWIVGMPLAIPMGVLVGILYMIPYFQYITLIPVTVICFIYSLGGTVEFLPMLGKCGLVYVVSQCLCDYVVTPHIMGKELGMNPAVILLALSVWGSLLGIIGMIIALPVTSLIMTYYERYISEPGAAPPEANQTGADTPDSK